ncbi:hypothetical protein ABC733_17240 [Mangrovibacter sp. SLW1]
MKLITICASGPSLIKQDCDLVGHTECPVIAVNSSWKLNPECQFIYAGDLRWWQKNISHVPKTAELWSSDKTATSRYGVKNFPTDTSCTFNSGQRAILFAQWLGAENIILLGYDCSIANGSHWHGDHPELDNPTPANIKRWKGEFERTAQALSGKTRVINCSRETALTCFPGWACRSH